MFNFKYTIEYCYITEMAIGSTDAAIEFYGK